MTRTQLAILTLSIIVCLRLLYVVKSEMGINLSHRYHAGDMVKLPAKALVHAVHRTLS